MISPPPRRSLLGLPLDDPGIDGLVDWLTLPDPATVQPRVAAYLNAHTVNLALRSGGRWADCWRRCDMVYPDGMSVVRAARRRGLAVRERVSGADFLLRVLWAAAARQRTIALVGGAEGLAEQCAAHLSGLVPGLRIVATHHGYLNPAGAEAAALGRRLAGLRPAITLLGMGSPRQEQLALRWRDEAHLPTIWCVGALFEYHTPGVRRHAPLWMREAGLEWLFRLTQEPRRLAGRYVLGNAEFLWRAALATDGKESR